MSEESDFRYGAWQRPDGSLFRAVWLDVTEGPKFNEQHRGNPKAHRYLTPQEVERIRQEAGS